MLCITYTQEESHHGTRHNSWNPYVFGEHDRKYILIIFCTLFIHVLYLKTFQFGRNKGIMIYIYRLSCINRGHAVKLCIPWKISIQGFDNMKIQIWSNRDKSIGYKYTTGTPYLVTTARCCASTHAPIKRATFSCLIRQSLETLLQNDLASLSSGFRKQWIATSPCHLPLQMGIKTHAQ